MLDSRISLLSRFLQLEPEHNPILDVVDAVLMAMRIHDGLDNRKADAGTAVSAGAGLIHLVELDPDLRELLFGDVLAGILYGNSYNYNSYL